MLVQIVGIGHAITVQLAINHGLGRHINFVLTRLSSIMKPGSISLLFGYLSPCLGRISFLYTLLFLAKTDARVKTWSIYMFIMGQVLINVTGIVVFYAQCGRNIDVRGYFQPQSRRETMLTDICASLESKKIGKLDSILLGSSRTDLLPIFHGCL
jgi:hypothetical protein